MAITKTIYKSRLARRLFTLFVASAMIPILVLAALSYYRVIRQLKDQTFERLHQTAKSHALFLFGDLQLADQQLQIIEALQPVAGSFSFAALPAAVMERTQAYFSGLAWVAGPKVLSAWGSPVPSTDLQSIGDRTATRENDGLLTGHDDQGRPWVALVRVADGSGRNGEMLIGIVDVDYLWGAKKNSILPVFAESCIWDDQGRRLFSSFSPEVALAELVDLEILRMPRGQTEIAIDGRPYLAAFWSIFLKPRFGVSHWTVMVLEPREQVFLPLRAFQSIFPFVLALTLAVVVWLSGRAIRKSLVPIESLMEGARRVADRKFSHQVVVDSSDEFQDLAAAFNHMTRQLDSQFRILGARSDLDRAILSALDIEQVINTGLQPSSPLSQYPTAAISVVELQNPTKGRTFAHQNNTPVAIPTVVQFEIDPQDLKLVEDGRDAVWIDAGQGFANHLGLSVRSDISRFALFPIWIHQRLFALVSVGVGNHQLRDQLEVGRIREFVDHLAVAFTNSDLVRELRELNLGTLYALARTVDANSSWTAGHSLRVTQMAVEMAAAMGLTPSSQEELQRAGLLHDIGKIGIPLSILDKKGALSPEEYEIIKGHPSIGAKILNPIRAYADIIPIVEQHHERYDGKGYPFGLREERIHLSARILAVADTFDAMVSDRPYRAGLGMEKARQIIASEAGKQFDPRVVETFLHLALSAAASPSAGLSGASALGEAGSQFSGGRPKPGAMQVRA